MEREKFEENLRINEVATMEFDLTWRKTVQKQLDEQEVVRRGIESLFTASKVCDNLSGDNSNKIKKVITVKLEELIKKLKPLT